ncbi:MAG: DMT family transporter [Betaproteobacteria bacterium]|nr:DMT family transporter [Betaproteobacteria bacterium]
MKRELPAHGTAYLLLALTILFWSGNWVIGRAVVGKVPPVALAYWRWLIAVAVILPFAWPHLRGRWSEIRREWRIVVPLALAGTGLHNLLSYLGLNYTTVTNGVMLNSSTPVMILLLGAAFFGFRVSWSQALGAAVSLTGVLAILTRGHPELLLALRFNGGDLIVIASMLLWALYTLFLPRRPTAIAPVGLLAVCGVIGLIAMAPLYAWEIAGGASIAWSWPVVAALLYVGVFPSFLGYIFWNRGVEAVGANVSGMFMHLMPVFGSLLAWLFLDERLQGFHFAGFALILAGIYWVSRRSAVAPLAAAGEE